MENNSLDNNSGPRVETRAEFMARIQDGAEFDPADLTDEELAALFPNFAAVWMDVARTLMERDRLKNSLQGDDQTS